MSDIAKLMKATMRDWAKQRLAARGFKATNWHADRYIAECVREGERREREAEFAEYERLKTKFEL